MLRIVSWNVNGIRACANKGFFDFLKEYEPDICCVQETKAQEEVLPDNLVNPSGYAGVWSSGERKGYSGVATFTKINPLYVQKGFDNPKFDIEGRVVRTDYQDFILFNVYFPNGQMNDDRLQYKLDFYQAFFDYCGDLRRDGHNLIITGDYNTAHKEIDLANPKANENYSGFLPVERAWIDKIISLGYVDVFREFNLEPKQYTWWTYRFGARQKNIGWRIDYFFVNKEFLPKVAACGIWPTVLGSDHCPIYLELA